MINNSFISKISYFLLVYSIIPYSLGIHNYYQRTKTPHRFLDEEFILNIEFYFNISPASYTLCRGYGIDIFLCILNRQSEFSEICEVGRIYFLPSAIAACGATSLSIKTVLKLSLTVRLIKAPFFVISE